MNREVGRDLPNQPAHAHILHHRGIHARRNHRARKLLGLGHLILEDEDVEGDIPLHPAPVQELHQLWQIGFGEVVRPHPRVEFLQAKVDRVRPVLDRGLRAFPIARRRDQLRQAGRRARRMTRFHHRKRSAPAPQLNWFGCSASAKQNLALKPVPNKSLFERRVKLFRRCSADAFCDQQFISRQPHRQERVQPTAAGLKGTNPNRLQDRQPVLRVAPLGPAQHHVYLQGLLLWLGRMQGTDGRFAMIAQQFDGPVQQYSFVLGTGRGAAPQQPDEDFMLRFLAHIAVHVG